jgi:hypothetical protein
MNKKACRIVFAWILAGMLLFQATAFAADATTAQQKYDELKAKGIFAGYADGSAGLDQSMNRAQFARVAALILGLEGIGSPDTKVVTEKPFDDVPLNHWAVEEISAAKEAGIIAGYPGGTFNPNGNVTIEQLAIVFVKALNLEPVEGAEVEGASEWAAAYVQAAIDAGLIPEQKDYTAQALRETMVHIVYESETQIRQYQQTQSTDSPEETAGEEQTDGDLPEEESGNEPEPIILPPSSSPPSSSPSPSRQALNLINGTVGTWTGVNETTFATAGVTGVTAANLADVLDALEEDGGAPWTATQIQSIVNAVLSELAAKQAALDAINDAAEGMDWTGINETTFTAAGVTGVTAANLADVLDALDEDGGAPWTVTQIQSIVNAVLSELATKQAALDAINDAAEGMDWTGINETTFTAAGVTGVTAANLADVLDALDEDGGAPWTVTQIQSIVDAVLADLDSQTPLALINAASSSGDWIGITAGTFDDAGIDGVTADNLYYVQAWLETATPPPPRTAAEIQALVDEALGQMAVEAIYDWLRGMGDAPTVAVFEQAGLVGVDHDNIEFILEQLEWAYMESQYPFAAPMSTKDDLQNVIDAYNVG